MRCHGFAPARCAVFKLRGRNKMCRLSGRHDLSILFARRRPVNSLAQRANSRLVHALVHIGQEYVDAYGPTLAPDSRHIVVFCLSSTTSRAADSSSKALVAWRVRRRAPSDPEGDSAKGCTRILEED